MRFKPVVQSKEQKDSTMVVSGAIILIRFPLELAQQLFLSILWSKGISHRFYIVYNTRSRSHYLYGITLNLQLIVSTQSLTKNIW